MRCSSSIVAGIVALTGLFTSISANALGSSSPTCSAPKTLFVVQPVVASILEAAAQALRVEPHSVASALGGYLGLPMPFIVAAPPGIPGETVFIGAASRAIELLGLPIPLEVITQCGSEARFIWTAASKELVNGATAAAASHLGQDLVTSDSQGTSR